MSKPYHADFDYSEAIANTQNESERRQLLAARQQKIQEEGLHGKVASNDAVSTWTEHYRPYYAPNDSSSATLTASQLYDAAEHSRMQRFERTRRHIADRLQRELHTIDQDYRAGMRQADIDARQSVQGNEEKMAALGLNMGGRYEAATSGTAESSRIALQNQYQSNLNQLGNAHMRMRAAARQSAADREAELTLQYLTDESHSAISRAQSTLQQYQADRSYQLSAAGLTGFLNGTPTLALEQQREQQRRRQQQLETEYQKLEIDRQQHTEQLHANAYERALVRWKTTGYVSAEDSQLLGVPAGTPTADVSYKNAQLSLQRWKAGYGY